MSLTEILPDIQTVLEMEPEELAPFVLHTLDKLPEQRLNRHNFTMISQEYQKYAGQHLEDFSRRVVEAWVWLESEQFLAPKPGTDGSWVFITRRGKKVLDSQDFKTYTHSNLLPSSHLDPLLAKIVRPLFIRGEYELAVFASFKEVEVRVRTKGNFKNSDYGIDLMKKAFNPQSGLLTDQQAEESEKLAMLGLFTGAIGNFKNPTSHRNVEFDDPLAVADSIHFANLLLRILERIKPSA